MGEGRTRVGQGTFVLNGVQIPTPHEGALWNAASSTAKYKKGGVCGGDVAFCQTFVVHLTIRNGLL